MCGIAGIILKQPVEFNLSEKIILMSTALRHRGPDGEGFVLSNGKNTTPYFNAPQQPFTRTDLGYIPQSAITTAPTGHMLALAHRRLSIIDLSEGGHQPMCNTNGKHWITFNGEIYNYIELREELKKTGHLFYSESDTEVVLAAYKAWGMKCVERFNGMWAFCIYDAEKQLCFASRDRFGVKPFYYVDSPKFFSFASEQKAFVHAGLIQPGINEKALTDYLFVNLPENRAENFFENITELWPGHNLVYNITTGQLRTETYYDLRNSINNSNDHLSEKELIHKIASAFENAVKLRLRSDVEVGTCLSGGIDSSALAVTISQHNGRQLNCFTSVFRDQPFNEEYFADLVAGKINARHHKVQPALTGFIEEVDQLVYSQDVPIWDTSTYAQYKVMELAKLHHIKVVLDGQGADELFAGYHHHFVARWNNLIANGQYSAALRDINASGKTIPAPFLFYLKERVKQASNFNQKKLSFFFSDTFIKDAGVTGQPAYYNDVNQQLCDDIYHTRLKSFLKCEDRCGMWHGVESRTPFSDDIELIDLVFSFNGNKKIKNGVSKHLLREAVKDKLPREIYTRYDKKGFETPMQQWMKELRPMVLSEIADLKFDFIQHKNLAQSNPDNVFHNKMLFKLFILARWQKVFKI